MNLYMYIYIYIYVCIYIHTNIYIYIYIYLQAPIDTIWYCWPIGPYVYWPYWTAIGPGVDGNIIRYIYIYMIHGSGFDPSPPP